MGETMDEATGGRIDETPLRDVCLSLSYVWV